MLWAVPGSSWEYVMSARFARTRRGVTLEAMEIRRLLSTVVVNTLADETIANSTRSLREAIASAVAGDTIQFLAGLSGSINLAKGELLIAKNLTISGPGAGTIKINGHGASRVLEITAAKTVKITGVTITGGKATQGGGIFNAGTL